MKLNNIARIEAVRLFSVPPEGTHDFGQITRNASDVEEWGSIEESADDQVDYGEIA